MRLLTQRERYLGIAVLAFAIFAFYSVTAWHVIENPVFSSPDETANYHFAQQVRETGIPRLPTTLPGAPRSVLNTGTALVPGSFPFFPWFLGQVGRFTGTFGIIFFGPALATLAVFAWHNFLRRVGAGKWTARIATFLFATFPITWFYASRGLWQNGVFLSAFVLCLWLSALAVSRRTWSISALAGLAWGVTLMVRPSEVSWVALGLLVLVISQWRRVPWKQVGIAVLVAVLPVIVALSIQRLTYGHASSVGYRTEGILTPAQNVASANFFRKAANVFFPFGMNFYVGSRTFWHQYFDRFWFLGFPAAAGLVWLVARKRTSSLTRGIIIAGGVSAVFLVVLYGNYQFVEYPVRPGAPLDSSYERYWLPMILLASAGSGWALAKLRRVRFGWYAVAVLLAGWVGWGSWALWSSEIGIRQTFPRFTTWQQQRTWIASVTPANAYIIGNDKVVESPRFVMGINTLIQAPSIAQIPSSVPVYFMLDWRSQLPTLIQMYPNVQFGELLVGPSTFLVPVRER